MAFPDSIQGGWPLSLANGLERVGCRRFYAWLAPEWHRLPTVRELRAGALVPVEGYRKGKRDARYYAGANGLRLLTSVPLWFGLRQYPDAAAFVVLYTLAAFHLYSMLTELYKYCLLQLADRWGRVRGGMPWPLGPDPVPPAASGYFAPYPFETKPRYQAIAMEWFRVRVAIFVDSLSGGPAQDRGSRKGLTHFIHDTVASEKIHLVAMGLSIVLAAPFYAHQAWGYAAWASLLVLLDFYLVLLQRYHRVRAYGALRLPRQR